MGLDINTEKGQKSLADEHAAHAIIKNLWKVDVIETPKESSAKCDGFLVKDNVIKALFETKCRYDMGYQELLERGTWLVTYEKIAACRKLSKALGVPFLGFLYLLPKSSNEQLLMYWKITDEKGEYQFKFQVQDQETQKTINGDRIVRENAYLPVEFAKMVVPLT